MRYRHLWSSICGVFRGPAVFALLVVVVFAGCGSEPVAQRHLALLRLGSVLGETREPFSRADEVREFRFPSDHGSHDSFRSEWWYLTVMLDDENGSEFGVQFTVFRQALKAREVSSNPWRSVQVYLGHLAMTDVDRGTHHEFQRLARGHPGLAGVSTAPFAVWMDGWRLHGGDEGFSMLELDARSDEFRVRLDLQPAKPVVLQGDQGLSHKGPDQASYYYSVPRLKVSGELWIKERLHRVTGSAWFDHEWSTSVLGSEHVGWDWFALHFDDGSDAMVFRLRRRDGERDVHDHGVRVTTDGESQRLSGSDYRLVPLTFWRDGEGVAWPVRWQLELGDQRLTIEAALKDQRMDTALVYWEGLVHVRDSTGARVGRGYMELTGYTP
ncbi:MAG: carotenoid 1,2-hydratase [Gammaproteobacteria bacterium]|nr:carotenoid 1,2-hydratase [Gammaproteobacteria bacterium]